ncbi:hypothetical protein AS029_08420 [Microbacterium enclense]|nr:hypothetical protein AS029_08420 [Microbacterium enclense]
MTRTERGRTPGGGAGMPVGRAISGGRMLQCCSVLPREDLLPSLVCGARGMPVGTSAGEDFRGGEDAAVLFGPPV